MNPRAILLSFSMNAMVLTSAALAEAPPYDFQYQGESIISIQSCAERLKPAREKDFVQRKDQEGKPLLALTASGSAKAVFSLAAPVEKEAEYLFRARVKSADQFVARMGGLSMSYNDLGNWQTVTGLYRTGGVTTAEIQFHLQSLARGNPASAEIKEISLVRVQRPATANRRHFSGMTDLVKNSAPTAAIVIPAGLEAYTEMAEKIRTAVREKTGVELPILSDTEATGSDFPALKPELKSRNLILLGRLGNNRAFWSAYNRFLTAVDGYYPGGDGYAVHTASNVFRTGGNHLIIGGTTDKGVQRGAEVFLEKLKAAEGGRKDLRLPWLLEVDLQGDCLAFFKTENAKWEEKPESSLLPKAEPGYGTVVRWYGNAMAYYWTGWESFGKRANQYLRQVLDEQAYTHHYISEFFVRVFDMLDESGVIAPEQIREVDALFTRNFLDFMTVGDLQWMTTFAPPYSQIGLVNRHQIAPWMADYKFAEFITDILQPEGGMKDLADFRRQEKERALTNFVTHRSNPSLPGGLLDEVYEEVNATFFRYALEKELYREFFGSGNARKALALERINTLTGQLSVPGGNRDSKLPLGIMASLTRDPEIHWLWKHLLEAGNSKGYFQGRYLGNVRRYTPDADTMETKPKSWTGIQFTPNPVDHAPLKADQENYYFLAVRSGFERDDDYLAFNGYTQFAPSGTLATLLSQGVSWLASAGKDGRFNTNSASAVRTDKPEGKAKLDDQSRCLWSAELPTGIALRFRQLLTHEIEWTRDFIRLGQGTFVFRDQFTARQEGTYLLSVAWHPIGAFSQKGDTSTFASRDGRLRIALSGDGFQPVPALDHDSGRTSLRNQAFRRLAKGESVVSYSVLQAAKPSAAHFKPVQLTGNERLAIGGGEEQTILDWNAATLTGIRCDAKLVIQTPKEAGFYDCSLLATDATDSHPTPQKPQRESFVDNGAFFTALRGTLRQPVVATKQDSAPDLQIKVRDARDRWEKTWSYDGFLRPAKVSDFRVLDGGIIDFGKELELAEIRGHSTTNYYTQGKLPDKILLATANQPNDAEAWKPAIGKRSWRPGIRTANYGEAHPEKEVDETVMLEASLRARYVKTSPATPLHFFTNSLKEARHPIRVEVGDFLKNGEVQTLVISDVFPQFPRPIRQDDLSLALLDTKGKAIFQKELVGPVQSIRLLDRNGDGTLEIFVLYGNATLEIYGFDGKLKASADLYKMHRDFAETHGKARKTRAPAGGYVLPFSVGLWRPDAAGQRKIVVTRYGGFTFLNPDLSFEGVLSVSGYATPGILPEGINFGSGSEEQVVVERLRIWQIGGDGKPTVRDPGGPQFWPQTYALLKSIAENEGSRVPLGGLPITRFELLSGISQQPRYILLARGTSLGIYDAKTKKIQYNWSTQAPITGVGIVKQAEGELELAVATSDSLLWNLHWKEGVVRDPVVSAQSFPDAISAIREGTDGLVLSGARGIYLMDRAGEMTQIADGRFQSAAFLPGPTGQGVIAVKQNGEVLKLTSK